MIETINALEGVETGTYGGIGSKLVALGGEVLPPEGVIPPERDRGIGWVGRYLGRAALIASKGLNLDLGSPVENGKIVDERVLAWLLIGRYTPRSEDGLRSERFVFSAEEIVKKALRTTAEIASLSVLQGEKKSATNWRSLFEGLVKADIFGDDFQPTIVTSLGGYDGPVPLAAPFNIVPGLELMQVLLDSGYDPKFIVTSAAKYGVDCNGLSLAGASDNSLATVDAYRRLVDEFYPELEDPTAFESLLPSAIESYPKELLEASRRCCETEESLRQTAAQYGAGPEAFVRYMRSHIQAFRDFQSQPVSPFVIKVGAPSELRFSQWQKRVIEEALPNLSSGFVPNIVVRKGDGWQYGPISLYYPRLGIRPPYYPDADDDEPALYGSFPPNYQGFLRSIPEDNRSLGRYARLATALETTRIKPNDYLALFSGANK